MRSAAGCLAIATALLIGSGCGSLPRWPGPWRRPAPCTFNANATKDEIVAHVNRFVTPDSARAVLTSWRATDVNFAINGLPGIPGTIAVEAPHRLRIRAAMPLNHSDVADIGANDRHIWFWAGPVTDKEIITVRREHVPAALQQMNVPFEPSWLMEVLGVSPINFDDFELRRPADAKAQWVDLVALRDTPAGEPVLRVVRVDLCQGHIIAHRIEHTDGTLIASAELKEYSPDTSGQFVMPHYVRLECPAPHSGGAARRPSNASGATLAFRLGPIHANPPALAADAWEAPRLAGLQHREFVPVQYASAPGGSRRNLREPVYEQTAEADSGTRMDAFTGQPSADGQPAGYSPAAWQSSSDQLPREPESGPRPFPARP